MRRRGLGPISAGLFVLKKKVCFDCPSVRSVLWFETVNETDKCFIFETVARTEFPVEDMCFRYLIRSPTRPFEHMFELVKLWMSYVETMEKNVGHQLIFFLLPSKRVDTQMRRSKLGLFSLGIRSITRWRHWWFISWLLSLEFFKSYFWTVDSRITSGGRFRSDITHVLCRLFSAKHESTENEKKGNELDSRNDSTHYS